MAVTTTYPGVYVQELPSGVRTIIGSGTSVTAFVGTAERGPVHQPVTIYSYADYERIFGGLWINSGMSYAVMHFFQNGGSVAVIARTVAPNAQKGRLTLPGPAGSIVLIAPDEGFWFGGVRVTVDHAVSLASGAPGEDETFNLTVTCTPVGDSTIESRREVIRNVSVKPTSPRYIGNVLIAESNLVRLLSSTATKRPNAATNLGWDVHGNDGSFGTETIDGSGYAAQKKGLYALDAVDHFDILCLPPWRRDWDTYEWYDMDASAWNVAAAYCRKRRAILLVDPPRSWKSKEDAITNKGALVSAHDNAALYFPRLIVSDPTNRKSPMDFAPCGVVAGVIARTDAARGIWKAPAGLDARLNGVEGLTVTLSEGKIGELNPLGINVLRTMPAIGSVIWGARTLAGVDRLASEWKYLPVRRLALHIEESLYNGTQWAVFEPNDESLWAQIRTSVGAFMHQLFRQEAFQGAKPSEAYFVKCDAETTTQKEINQGVVNIIVGFAPLKPAEFVVVKIQQMAGQIQA